MNSNFLYFLYLILLVFISNTQIPGQQVYDNSSQPFIKYYSPKEYRSANSNWSILQDKRGIMYFGNETGIVEFDGTSWRKIEVPQSSLVRSMAIDNYGTIYVCASSDFGYLTPDSVGQLTYKSLINSLNPNYKNIGEVWDVITNSKGVYFKTDDKVFRWNGKNFTIIDSIFSFRFYKIGDDIFARNEGTGLMKIDGDSAYLIPGGEFFISTGVFDMLPYKDTDVSKKKILLTTNYKGLFLYDGKSFIPFKTDADTFIMKNQIYNACIGPDGNFIFATQRGGAAIIDPNGHLLKIINEDSGLPTNVVYDVYYDNQGGLWLATSNGIVHCETPSPFSIIPRKGLLKDQVSSLKRINNTLYASNFLGILYLDESASVFKLIKGSNKPGMDLLAIDDILLAATNWGVGIIEDYNLTKMLTTNSTNLLLHSRFYKDRIYAGHREGFSIFIKQKNKPAFTNYSTVISEEEIIEIVEESDKSLWLLSDFGVLIHITDDLLNSGGNKDFERYTSENGLPGSKWDIHNIDGRMILATDKGVYSFHNISKSFIKDTVFGKSFADSMHAVFIEKSLDNNYWILSKVNEQYEFGKAALQKNGSFSWYQIPEFNRLDLSTVIEFYSDRDTISKTEVLWFSTDEGVIKFDPKIYKNIEYTFPTLIRKAVSLNDSLIYAGSSINKNHIISFDKNNIGFEVSALCFDKSEGSLFQYYLEGNDKEWSQWTPESKKYYTNLSPGSYLFQARSKNVYGIIGKEDVFRFTILPPWYLTWWAYIIYFLLFIAGIVLTDRIMRRRVIQREHDKAKLREAELIQKQAEELETVDKLVRIINNAEDLETLFNSLLKQTISFIPQAENAAVFLLDHNDNSFHIAFTLGYDIPNIKTIEFTPDELKRRYTENSEEIEKGIFVINNTKKLYADEKLLRFNKAQSMLVMAVEWDNNLEAYVVFDSFADKKTFNSSTARILHRFREHAVSAILKAQTLKTLQEKNKEIIRTQEQLMVQQKLASLGALTAGIAHEIKNPLNFINNFAELSSEIADELAEKLSIEKSKLSEKNFFEINKLLNIIKENTIKINNHGNRADSIIKGMLLHSRGSSGERIPVNLNSLLEQYVNLSYHGIRAKDKEFNITIERDYDESIGAVNIVPQDISRVFLNIINNACYAANEKKLKCGNEFTAKIKVSTKNLGDKVEIKIMDNGNGIPPEIRDKLFNPFFTTKPTGEGTGLGLSISYDIIVKQHQGELRFETKENEYTEFIITISKK